MARRDEQRRRQTKRKFLPVSQTIRHFISANEALEETMAVNIGTRRNVSSTSRPAQLRKCVKRKDSCKASKNFHECNLLGRGGFGPVYRGKLQDGRLVAIKKLSFGKSKQGEPEFLAEAKMITSIQHKNLVRLLGCCCVGPQRVLVYEYMNNRSLDGIVYGSSLRIKLISAPHLLEHSPEYAIRGELSEKADIYSFGVVVLEIISCRRNTDLTLSSEMQYLPEYAWKLYERSKMIDLIDPRMQKDGFSVKDVMKTIHVALLCLQPLPDIRPAMSEVVAMLTWNVDMVKSPIKPTFLDRRRPRNDENVSWETISNDFPSPLETESPSLTQPPNSREFDVKGEIIA
ncbi:hypothetical protein L1987_21168 [Smallanthus sonchifolius]|uniref:Uncharacterized protein n=1 Tax=Smallanthus sonchifolius TaxID=185202 RepID=A0ACB9IU56_9ASTR|nr:hypothetical protein L1987_21168 [Smallanthus sonchifolius]